MNLRKTITISTLCALSALLATAVAQSPKKAESKKPLKERSMPWIPFQWESNTVAGRVFEKAVITAAIKVADIPHNFHAQFDLGASSTMLYENTIAPYMAKYPGVVSLVDTTATGWINGVKCPRVKGVDLTIGKVPFKDRNILLYKGYGTPITPDSMDIPTTKHIGTIAADLFKDGVLIIDFPHKRFCGAQTVPTYLERDIQFIDMEFIEETNWVFIPMEIGGVTRKVLFDTGSSLFPLISSIEKIAQIADTTQVVDTIRGSSWGNETITYGCKPNVAVSLAGITLNDLFVYHAAMLEDEALDEMGFWAIIGNRYFLDRIVVIDYKNKKFGISKSKK